MNHIDRDIGVKENISAVYALAILFFACERSSMVYNIVHISESMNMASINSESPSSRVTNASVLDFLRTQIISGKCAPGTRLPSRREIIDHLGASSVTVQRAMDNLMRDGFAYSDGRNGTFVAAHPPHLGRYALLLPSQPTDHRYWRRFTTVMVNESARLASSPRRTLVPYYEINGHTDSEGYQTLLRDLRAHRLAGLISAGDPTVLLGTPLMDESAPPRVAFMESPTMPGMAAIWHDHHSFIDVALSYLHKRGRRRIAVITGEFPGDGAFSQYLVSSMESLKMIHHPYWLQSVFVGHPALVTNVAWLLLQGAPNQRPDGLIICDDNLVDDAIVGVHKSGVSVPKDLDVVAHANLPWPAPMQFPIHRIGYHVAQTLEVAMDLIDRQRRNEPVPRITRIPAAAEHSSHV